MNYDSLIGFGIIIFLFLVIAARITGQTVPEFIEGIKDMIGGGKEEVEERVGGVIDYE